MDREGLTPSLLLLLLRSPPVVAAAAAAAAVAVAVAVAVACDCLRVGVRGGLQPARYISLPTAGAGDSWEGCLSFCFSHRTMKTKRKEGT